MAKLAFVQQRRSIFRCVLFAVFLELTIVSKCASSQKICIPGSRRDISYVNVYNDEVDWNTARQKCIAANSTLPVICNNEEQDAFVDHLKGNRVRSAAWTSGKMIFTNWMWIDGKPFTGSISSPEYESYIHVAFDKRQNNYKALDHRHPNYYLCQYSGSLCNSENAINVTNGCVIPSINDTTWFNARNQCIANGSDLAVLTDADLDTLKRGNKLQKLSFWIGLQKNTTRHWMWLTTEKSSEDITYTNWSGVLNRREDECLSIDASNGEWKAVGCTDKKMVVCEIKLVSDATPTLYSSTTNARVMSRVTMASSVSSVSGISTESGMNPMSNGDSHFLLYWGICAGVVGLILVICIIVVILVVRHTRKSPKMTDHCKGEIDSEQNGRKESPNKQTTSLIHAPANAPTNTPSNAPANAPVARTDDALGIYAEITPAPLNQSEDEAKIQQPGVLYAALEFQKEPTYLEPGQKSAHASNQTKVGPMGDIYATPDAKGRTGNEATSHPLLVTSQGDIYALPAKNSKSTTPKSPVGGIYANLRT